MNRFKPIFILILALLFIVPCEDALSQRRKRRSSKRSPVRSYVDIYGGAGYSLMMHNIGGSKTPGGGAGMNIVMYLMPIMFLFIFNNYASGLSYYYFVSLLITIGQTYLFRLFVDEKKLLKKIEAAKAKPKKKSGFMARLEAAQKAQQEAIRKQQQQQHRKR